MRYSIEITLILFFIFCILWMISNKQDKKYKDQKNKTRLKIKRKNKEN